MKDSHLIRRLFESYAYVSGLIEDKNTSSRHLRQLFFGSRTEKTEAVVGANARKIKAALARNDAAADESSADDANSDASDDSTVTRGHGRNGAEAYQGAERVHVAHPTLRAGDACPACGKGTVYDKGAACWCGSPGGRRCPRRFISCKAFRCNLCGQVMLRSRLPRPVRGSTTPPPPAV